MAGLQIPPTQIAINKRFLPKMAFEEPGIGFDMDRKVKKESRHKIIEKKRQMFHMQMMLNTKLRQIQKLEQKEDMMQKGLTISQKMLAQDSQAFEKFCRGVADDLAQANQKADSKTREKQKSQASFKTKSDQVDAEQSKITKFLQILQQTNKYKDFLTQVAPKTYQQQVARKKHERDIKKQCDLSTILQKVPTDRKQDLRRGITAAHQQINSSNPVSTNQSATRKPPKIGSHNKQFGIQIPSHIQELIDQSDQDLQPPFHDEEALNQKFRQYEEKNLILVQTTQDLEQQIQEFKQDFQKKQDHYEHQLTQLKQTQAELQKSISGSMYQVQKYKNQLDKHQDSEQEKRVVQRLEDTIRRIYLRQKKSAAIGDSRMKGVQMMTFIESKIEGLMSSLSQLDPEKVDKKMREKDRYNRKIKQELKKNLEIQKQQRKQMERKDDTKRVKYMGKPIMFRSQKPAAKKKEVKKVELTEEQRDYLKYMAD